MGAGAVVGLSDRRWRVRPEYASDAPELGAGPARPVHKAGTAFFFKQWGGRTPKQNGRVLDGRTWDQMPAGHRLAAEVRA
jgi:hypothetical protein